MGLISRVSSRTYRRIMRFAKREAGKWATYNVKEASSWSEQQKETQKLLKLTNTTNQLVKPISDVQNKKKKAKKSRKYVDVEAVENDKEDTPEEKLFSSNDEQIKKNLGGKGIYKIGGACHECGSTFHLVRDCPEVEKRRREKKLKKKNQFREEDDGTIPIAHGFVMDSSRGIEDEYYINR